MDKFANSSKINFQLLLKGVVLLRADILERKQEILQWIENE
jgi:hypothetical protein